MVVGAVGTMLAGGLSALACVSLATIAGPRAASYADVAEAAALMAHPLARPGQRSRQPDRSEMMAGFERQIAGSDRLAGGRTELAPIALEYSAGLRELNAFLLQGVDFRPALRSGFEAFQGYRSDDNWAFWSGLFGVGMELYEFSAKADQIGMLHSRIVACRLRLAEVAARTNQPASLAIRIEWGFEEQGVDPGATEDRFVLKNATGAPLTNVLLVTTLQGRSGETFSNCYFTPSWADGEVLHAPCASNNPWRETVRNVAAGWVRIHSAEGTTEASELRR